MSLRVQLGLAIRFIVGIVDHCLASSRVNVSRNGGIHAAGESDDDSLARLAVHGIHCTVHGACCAFPHSGRGALAVMPA